MHLLNAAWRRFAQLVQRDRESLRLRITVVPWQQTDAFAQCSMEEICPTCAKGQKVAQTPNYCGPVATNGCICSLQHGGDFTNLCKGTESRSDSELLWSRGNKRMHLLNAAWRRFPQPVQRDRESLRLRITVVPWQQTDAFAQCSMEEI